MARVNAVRLTTELDPGSTSNSEACRLTAAIDAGDGPVYEGLKDTASKAPFAV
jgi:hypothetical protein